MGSKIFAIYDPEEGFAERLARALTREEYDYRFRAFTDRSSFLDALQRERASVALVATGGMSHEESRDFLAQVRGFAKHCFRFSPRKRELGQIAESVPEFGAGPDDTASMVRRIYQYQNAQGIFRDVMETIRMETLPERIKLPGRAARKIAVFSPKGGCGKSTLALRLAQELSAQGRALLLQMDTFSEDCVREDRRGDLGDCFYYLRQNCLDKETWEGLHGSLRSVDVIGPPLNPEDMEEIGPEEWASFLEALAGFGYAFLVLDAGSSFRTISMAFESCDAVVVPGSGEPDGKWEHFMRYLKGTGHGSWESRIRRIRYLPRPEERAANEAEVRKLAAEYAR